MSKETKLTAAQVHELEPFERHFRQAVDAAWCSYPGQAGINKMLDIWQTIAGSQYPYKPGCPNCLLNLVRDLGTLYFAQKDGVLAEEAAKVAAKRATEIAEREGERTEKMVASGLLQPGGIEAPAKVAETAEKPVTEKKAGKTTSKGKKAVKTK